MADLTKEQREYVAGIRDVARFLEAHPEAIHTWQTFPVNLFAKTAPELTAMGRRFGGKWDKEILGRYFVLRRTFGPVTVKLNVERDQVCERVQVGEVSREVPDPDAPKVVVTEPVYEWICPDSLFALDAS